MAASPPIGLTLVTLIVAIAVVAALVVLGVVIGVLLSRRSSRREGEGAVPPLRPEALGARPSPTAAPAAAPAPAGRNASDTASGRTAVFSFPTLHVKDHYGLENSYRLEFGDFHIGAGADNDLVLAESGVAQRQARIRLEGSVYIIENLGDPGGVRVNGAPVDRQPLKNEDVITLGKSTVRITGLSA